MLVKSVAVAEEDKSKIRKASLIHSLDEVLGRDMGQINKELDQLEKQVSSLITRRESIKKRLAAAKEVGLSGITRMEQSLRELDRMKAIESYAFLTSTPNKEDLISAPNLLVLNTDTIVAKDKDYDMHYYLMGKYRIIIDLVSADVKIYNRNKYLIREAGYGLYSPHPHVNVHDACFGSVSTMVVDYIDQGEYGALAAVLVEFLRSVNLGDSAGVGISNWPRCRRRR